MPQQKVDCDVVQSMRDSRISDVLYLNSCVLVGRLFVFFLFSFGYFSFSFSF